MDNSTNEELSEQRFAEKYLDYTDEQILEILRFNSDYQEIAVEAAVKIAIDRKLIHSKQDLLGPEFRKSISTKKTLFPTISNDYHRDRLIGSIFRLMFLITVLPIGYGILYYSKGEINQAVYGLGIGLFWLFLCFIFRKTKQKLVLMLLFMLIIGVSSAIGFRIFSKEVLQIMDVIILVIGTLLMLYLLLYLKVLVRKSD